MECAEIRSGFASGRVPDGPAVSAHVQACPHCRVLFESDARLGRALALGQLAAPEPGQLFEAVSRDLQAETGPRARLRSLATSTRVMALLVLAVTLTAYQLLANRRPDFASYSPGVFWGIATLLFAALAAGAWKLLRGPLTPLDSSRAGWVLPLWLALPALAALLAPLGAQAGEGVTGWGGPFACFGYGAALVIPLLLWWWLSERRDSVPLAGLVAAGAVAGLAANLVLHAHCPSVHLGHLLLGHASIGVAWAVGLGLLSGRLQRSR
ncbi:MAG TPA: hypothetical protein VIW29_18280 [Polyangiaceae bacterium]